MADDVDGKHEFDLRRRTQDFEATSGVPDEKRSVCNIGEGRIIWDMCLRIVIIESDAVKNCPLKALRHHSAVPRHTYDLGEGVIGAW